MSHTEKRDRWKGDDISRNEGVSAVLQSVFSYLLFHFPLEKHVSKTPRKLNLYLVLACEIL
jgi:hypothetical protein